MRARGAADPDRAAPPRRGLVEERAEGARDFVPVDPAGAAEGLSEGREHRAGAALPDVLEGAVDLAQVAFEVGHPFPEETLLFLEGVGRPNEHLIAGRHPLAGEGEDLANPREGETQALKPLDRLELPQVGAVVEAEPAATARGGTEKAELLVVTDRPEVRACVRSIRRRL
jgi:hypothetical protein